MIFGSHVIVYSKDAEADRAFFRDVLGFPSVDAGDGWLIFSLPPAEAGVHPSHEQAGHELFLMSDNLAEDVVSLRRRGVLVSEVEEAGFGSLVRITCPSQGEIRLYQPKHPLAVKKPAAE
ncbi:MAG TPA: hypothetical protein VKR27_01270 [Acidimicrobiales bacterium]|nr:hypothetical protein [Acidimicrobiales bacterium]